MRRPLRLSHVRIRRPRPGLRAQHLTVVRALAAIADAETEGVHLGSTEIEFRPRALRAGDWRFDVGEIHGSAGAVSLLFQALLLPLVLAAAPSRLTLVGGTHVPWSPPVHYLTEVFLPALATLGAEASLDLLRWGWYPAGGGEVTASVRPSRGLRGLVLPAPGDRPPGPGGASPPVTGLSAVSRLPRTIAERQRSRMDERLRAAGVPARIALVEDRTAAGPGTLAFLAVRGRAGFSALGRRGLPAERVADLAVDPLLDWLASGAAVDGHLADQLLPFLALAPGPSAFSCPGISSHLATVAWVVEQLLPVRVRLAAGAPSRVEIVAA